MAEILHLEVKTHHCPYCGTIHPGYCPRIASISYYDETGDIEEIYFLPWYEWPENFERLMKEAVEHNAGVLAAMEKHHTGGHDH